MKIFNPATPVLGTAARVAKAKELLYALVDHTERIRASYPRGATFLEDMAGRFAVGATADMWVSEKQLEFLQGLYDQYVEGKRKRR